MAKVFSLRHRRNLSKALKGRTITPEWRENMRQAKRGLFSGELNPMFGRKHSAATRLKMSRRHSGVPRAEETKRKLRVCAIKQHRNNGVSFPAIDHGALEEFARLNMAGFHVQYPNFEIVKLGYFLDGYDAILHAVFEYDTPIHLRPVIRSNDLKRQQRIIRHFESTGQPLKAFYRINATGVGEPGMKNVLVEGGQVGK